MAMNPALLSLGVNVATQMLGNRSANQALEDVKAKAFGEADWARSRGLGFEKKQLEMLKRVGSGIFNPYAKLKSYMPEIKDMFTKTSDKSIADTLSTAKYSSDPGTRMSIAAFGEKQRKGLLDTLKEYMAKSKESIDQQVAAGESTAMQMGEQTKQYKTNVMGDLASGYGGLYGAFTQQGLQAGADQASNTVSTMANMSQLMSSALGNQGITDSLGIT